jgi:hypothetical protein
MAGYSKTLVVLANSCKHNGRCVAGKALGAHGVGDWIRPTSAHATGALYPGDQRVIGGALTVLDVVEVPLARPAPVGFQSENHRIAPGRPWIKRGRLAGAALRRAVDAGPLWRDGESSLNGLNDRVPAARLAEVASSLRLIGPLRLDLQVRGERVRARFVHGDTPYNLSVTDPWVKRAYAQRPEGWYGFGQAFLCLSLAPPWHGFAYKLAAAVIPAHAN